MRKLILFLLLIPAFSIYFSSSSTYPETLVEQGYLYITFCSTTNEYAHFKIYASGFEAYPSSFDVYFSGSTSMPDCRQLIVFVKAERPGMYSLKVKEGSDEWYIPVIFQKKLPLLITLSKNILYTGYDSVKLILSGNGRDVWVTVYGNLLGSNVLHSDSFPAVFDLTFHFSRAGFYSIPLLVRYTYGNSTIIENYTIGLRVEEPPIEIKGKAEIPSEGYANLTFAIYSPEELYSTKVELVSDCIEGDTEKFLEVLKNATVTFKVKGKCDPGVYKLKIKVGDYERVVPMQIKGPEGFDVLLSPSYEKGKATLEVTIANIGSDTLKAVSVKLLPGDYTIEDEGTFLGDLEPGDFDSADLKFIPAKLPVEIHYQIAFTKEGERILINKTYEFAIVSKKTNYWIFALLLIPVIYYARARKARSEVSGS